jgi:hypothetical protein
MDMKHILQAMDGVATKPVVGANDMKKFLQVVTEGANPHKVTLPVQMAMQHYQKEKEQPQARVGKTSVVGKYFNEVEQEQLKEQNHRRQLINQYAGVIAERVLMKENEIAGHSMGFKPGPGGPGLQSAVAEAPLDFDKENPSASTIHGHKSNPGSIEYRIMRARAQLKDLAAKADSNELIVWESIARHFPELAMNIEEIRHGIEELANIRKQGGRRTANIPKEIGEDSGIKEANAKKRTLKNTNPCWTGYHPVGTKNKNGHTVPNCVPKSK